MFRQRAEIFATHSLFLCNDVKIPQGPSKKMSKKTLSLVSGPPKVPKNGFLLLNRLESILGNKDEEAAASHVASQKFIQLMLDEIQKFGYGFVPFVGAGFSVSSGIPILNQFHHYLQRCICVAVGAEAD